MTALARIHGGKTALTTLDDRSASGTPFHATATITAGTTTPATIIAAGFVHDPYTPTAMHTSINFKMISCLSLGVRS
uniref:Uncharacterized protein n=1 Tax=Leersia perrieri TaxID=77586 RepID=A0A0D9UXM5_9ORYZ